MRTSCLLSVPSPNTLHRTCLSRADLPRCIDWNHTWCSPYWFEAAESIRKNCGSRTISRCLRPRIPRCASALLCSAAIPSYSLAAWNTSRDLRSPSLAKRAYYSRCACSCLSTVSATRYPVNPYHLDKLQVYVIFYTRMTYSTGFYAFYNSNNNIRLPFKKQ